MCPEGPAQALERANLYISRNRVLFGVVVFLLALSLRLAYLNQIHQGIYHNILKMEGTDCFTFIRWAFALAEQGLLAPIDITQSALYPYFLASLFKMFGTKVYIARLAQMILGSLTCLMVFLIGKRGFSPLAGLIAGVLAAAYGPLIFYDGVILRANLITFLNTLLVLLMLFSQERLSPARTLAIGFIYGLCILAKPSIIIFVPGIMVWFWLIAKELGTGKKALLATGVMAIGTFIPLSVMFARNAALLIPAFSLTTKGTTEFISGNVPESPGIGWVIPDSAGEIVERSDGKMPRVILEVLKENREHPGAFIRQQFRKLGAFLNAYEFPNNVNIYVEKRYVPFMRLPWPGLSLALAFGLIGLAFGLKRWREIFPLYGYLFLYSIGTVAFYILARFRMPVIPVLIVFAGAGVLIILETLLGRQWLRTILLLGLAALAGILSRPHQDDMLMVSDYHNMARYHLISGEPEKAAEIWQEGIDRAREILIQKPSAESHYRVALFLVKVGGDLNEALEHLREAEGMDPPTYLKASINRLRRTIQQSRVIMETKKR